MEGALVMLLLAMGSAVHGRLRVLSQEWVHARVGDSVELPCSYLFAMAAEAGTEGGPRVNVQWFRVSHFGYRMRLAFRQEPDAGVADIGMPEWADRVQLLSNNSLVLRDVNVGDQGGFTCQVSAGRYGSGENITQLRVYKHPEVSITASSTPIGVLHEPGKVATCVASHGFPASPVTWLKDGHVLPETQAKNYDLYMVVHEERNTQGLYTLTSDLYLRPNRSDVRSQYRCRARGITSRAVNVTLMYPSEQLSLSVSPSGPIAEGDTVTLHCTADGNPAPEFTFSRSVSALHKDAAGDDGGDYDDGDEDAAADEEELQSSMDARLVIAAATRADSARYRCSGVDIDFPETTPRPDSVRVHVNFLDELQLSPAGPLTVMRGQDAALSCSSLASGPVAYTWWRGPQAVAKGPELRLLSAEQAQAGAYTCRAALRSVPSLGRSATIAVSVEDKPRIVAPVRVLVQDEGVSVTLSCEARGPPTPHLTWSIATTPREESLPGGVARSSVHVTVSSELLVRGVACAATNAHGETEHRFFFSVAEPTPMPATPAPQEEASMVIALVVTLLLLLVLLAAALGGFFWYRRRRSGSSNLESKAHSGQRPQPGGIDEKKPLQDRSLAV